MKNLNHILNTFYMILSFFGIQKVLLSCRIKKCNVKRRQQF